MVFNLFIIKGNNLMEFKMDGSHKGSRRGRSRFSDFYTLNNWNRLQK